MSLKSSLISVKRKFGAVYKQLRYKNRIKSFHNIYEGKRCFVIGNGPSLTVEDLEMIRSNNDISFASNLVFKCFEDTEWRPDFYCVQDFNLIRENLDSFEKIYNEYKCGFYPINLRRDYKKSFLRKKNNYFFEIRDLYWENDKPQFSFDISNCSYEGFTVTYFMIQLALYMGFKEIYLLGIDHSYGKNNDAYSDILKDAKTYNPPRLDRTTQAYEYADEMVKSVGAKVFNATRGGYLEAFERVNFDSLF